MFSKLATVLLHAQYIYSKYLLTTVMSLENALVCLTFCQVADVDHARFVHRDLKSANVPWLAASTGRETICLYLVYFQIIGRSEGKRGQISRALFLISMDMCL